ncbi:unnamed protein product [Clonostachys rosea f. rosea IK726]|uniref:Uncharacterized protein n=1 Tax=Clonostachys rosea f. rosea IK726 TaxID=1349383 RepID=A0ACA9TN35_BIOOC|nr:unnamed protein product [Clonostachys rosea f. rosea IK726]
MDRDHAFIHSRAADIITLNFLSICEQPTRSAKPSGSFLFHHILQLRVRGHDSRHPYRFLGDAISNRSFLLNHVIKALVNGSEHSRRFFDEYIPNRDFSRRETKCPFITRLKLLLSPLYQAYLAEYISAWHAELYRVQSYYEHLRFQFESWLPELSKLANRLGLQDISNIRCFSNRKPLYNRDNFRHANRTHDWSDLYYSVDVYRKLDLHSTDGSHDRSEFQQINDTDNRSDPHYTDSTNDRSDLKRTNGVYGRHKFHCTNSPYDGSKFHLPYRLYFKCTNRAYNGPDFHYPRYFYNRPDFEHSNTTYNRADLHYARRLFRRFDFKYAYRIDNWPNFHYFRWFDSRPEFKYTNRAYDGSDYSDDLNVRYYLEITFYLNRDIFAFDYRGFVNSIISIFEQFDYRFNFQFHNNTNDGLFTASHYVKPWFVKPTAVIVTIFHGILSFSNRKFFLVYTQ